MPQSSSGGSGSPCWWYGSCPLCTLPWTALTPCPQPWGSAASSHPLHAQHPRQCGHPLPQYLNPFLWTLHFHAPEMPLRAQQMCSEPGSPHRTLQPLPRHLHAQSPAQAPATHQPPPPHPRSQSPGTQWPHPALPNDISSPDKVVATVETPQSRDTSIGSSKLQ